MSRSTSINRVFAQLRGSAAADVPVEYELTCDCGTKLSGRRGTSSKQHVCADCRTECFVLPVNVYPRTPSVPSEVIGGSFMKRLSGVMSERLPGRRGTTPAIVRPRRKAAVGPSVADVTESASPIVRPKWRRPKIDVARFLRRTFRPFRLLVLGMAFVVVGTTWYIWQQNRIEAARITWRESLDRIPGLLAEDNIDDLSQTLHSAVIAGRMLGRDGEEWREVLNLLSETEVIRNVSYATLPALLLEACDDQGQLLNSRLDSLREALDGVYFVMDGFMDPSGDAVASHTIDIPVLSGSRPLQVRVNLPELNALLDRTTNGQIVFAFRCLEVTSDGNSDYDAVFIDVDPLSFVLFTRNAHCLRLGLSVEDDPQLSERLAVQLEFIRESAAWAQRAPKTETQSGETPIESTRPARPHPPEGNLP